MTAVVGILNKQAVAIAADSAVSMDGNGGRKIFNRANKIFTLSKHRPVGIMIYGFADFLSTPWEVIIKVYREQLGKRSFDTLNEFQLDFIKFLRLKSFYATQEQESLALADFLFKMTNEVISEVVKETQGKIDLNTPLGQNELLTKIEEKTDTYIAKFEGEARYCEDLAGLERGDFDARTVGLFPDIFKRSFDDYGYVPSDNLKEKLKNLAYVFIKTKETITNYTGLVFAGFGDEEIYPSLIAGNISFPIGDKLKYYVEPAQGSTISNYNSSGICPFGQIDVINTILTGVDPLLENVYLANFKASFEKYNKDLLQLLGQQNPAISAQISALNIDTLIAGIKSKTEDSKFSNYIQPLINAVTSLSKEDLVEMAESLIYLTYLKRRITFAEESVGGPVDVAVISKGDGFIWIKRKHYFKPELNQRFFKNYYSNE